MSVETLSYDYIGRFVTPAATISGTMAAVRNAFSSATYSDGSARTPGAGIAWSGAAQESAGQTLALSLTPATSSLGQKIIVAGGGGGTPTMISPDTYANTRVYVGLCKNAGAYASWTNVNPFGTGQYSGLVGFSLAVAAVHVYESKDSIVMVGETSAGGVYITALGALIDPESADPSVAETDGKLYGIFTTNTANLGSTPHANANIGTNSFLAHDVAAVFRARSYVMNVGASTLTGLNRVNVTRATDANYFKNAAGEFVRMPIYLTGTYWVGRLREILTFPQSLMGTRFTSGGQTKGFIIGGSTASTGECMLLRKA